MTWGSSDDGGSTCTTVATEFNVQAETHYGQEVYVVGSIPELGSWDPASGLRLSTNETSYPWWGGSTGLPVGTEFEYKYVKIDGSGNVVWQEGDNRVATAEDSGGDCTQAFTDHWS
ncbi:carbohydrate-binding module family 20 domain-containing protein [Nocardiopsis sp. FIRDI 009]|uniref:carbohydrate-binding module family 20 domain-containing protein n=1 Tax=Nocardiopsis sp. FIRDI 009 TaxID=714197 RepID=UPI001E3AAD14|nr:carbohydrate-binding module family 20 domain-containing protein [Nocardiopsis sp. FIRDI 009]